MNNSRKGLVRRRDRLNQGKIRTLHCEHLEDRRMLAVITVTTNQDVVDFNDGVTSLREAIFATNIVPGADEIVFDFGHDGPETILLTLGELRIEDSLTITGDSSELLTINVSGNEVGSGVFVLDDGDDEHLIDVDLHGIKITGAIAGVLIESLENLTINEVVISGNSSSSMIANRFGDLSITSSQITDNDFGSRVIDVHEGELLLADSGVSGNTGIFISGGTFFGLVSVAAGNAEISRSSISDNSIPDDHDAAALDVVGGLLIEDSEIADNEGLSGVSAGTTRDVAGSMTVRNSTVSRNSGGGLSFFAINQIGAEVLIANSTVAENGGTGIAVGRLLSNRGNNFHSVTIVESMITGNTVSTDSVSFFDELLPYVGGIGIYAGEVTIADSVISNNAGLSVSRSSSLQTIGGGGIRIRTDLNATINNSNITANTNRSKGSAFGRAGGISVEAAEVSISDSQFYDNSTDGFGGGILLEANLTTIARSSITGNEAGYKGGGAYVIGALHLSDSVVSNNVATDGGGLMVISLSSLDGTCSITRSTINDNSAMGGPSQFFPGLGGGILSYVDLTIDESTVMGNSAAEEGGGIYAAARIIGLELLSSTVAQNTAPVGGGIWVDIGSIENSTISSNKAAIGGGIFVGQRVSFNPPQLSVSHSTITANIGNGWGSGIFAADVSVIIDHTILSRNRGLGPDLATTPLSIVDVRYSLIGLDTEGVLAPAPVGSPDANGNLIGGPTRDDAIDPMLGPLADNGGPTLTHALLPGSPAIDAGDPNFVAPPTFDQRGAPYARLAGGSIDIGAFEIQSEGGLLNGNFNGDGQINGRDAMAWLRGFGNSAVTIDPIHAGHVDEDNLPVWEATFGAQPNLGLVQAATNFAEQLSIPEVINLASATEYFERQSGPQSPLRKVRELFVATDEAFQQINVRREVRFTAESQTDRPLEPFDKNPRQRDELDERESLFEATLEEVFTRWI